MSKKHFRFALTDTTAEFRRQGHASTDIRDFTTQIDEVSIFVSFSSRMQNLSITRNLSVLVDSAWSGTGPWIWAGVEGRQPPVDC